MKPRRNRRKYIEYVEAKKHLKLGDLEECARDLTEDERYYISKDSIPAYPLPKLRISRLKHDTDLTGLKGIKKKKGFLNRFKGSMVWFSLDVGPKEIKEAESRPMKTTYLDQPEELVRIEQGSLKKFASSPVFQQSSRYGSYRFTFSVKEVLDAYKHQFCSGADPVMRVMETVLYKKEVMYVVLVHSPTNQKQFSKYPLLSENSDPVCTFRHGRFIWTPEAMCKTHSYKLVRNIAEKTMKAEMNRVPETDKWYVWDHVTIALHVREKVLEFDVDQLREKLTFCEKGDVKLNKFEDFQRAKWAVQQLWPDYGKPLMRNSTTTEEVPEG